MAEDPGEHNNLAADSDRRKIIQRMEREMPTELASGGFRPKDKAFVLVKKGEHFEWRLKENADKGKRESR